MTELFFAVDVDGRLLSVDWDRDFAERNGSFSLSWLVYDQCVDDASGFELARKKLSNPCYWRVSLAHLPKYILDNVDWDGVAEDCISAGGWQVVDGEFYEFGEFAGRVWFFNVAERSEFPPKIVDVKHWLVPRMDVLRLYTFRDGFQGVNTGLNKTVLSRKKLSELYDAVDKIFDKHHKLAFTQEALKRYKKVVGR